MRVVRRVIFYEAAGFAAVSLLLWLDEILDVPHYLMGAPRTPVNIAECVLESGFVLVFGLAVLFATRQLPARIGYLEGTLPICSYCKKIRTPDRWVQFETYVDAHSEARLHERRCSGYIKDWLQ